MTNTRVPLTLRNRRAFWEELFERLEVSAQTVLEGCQVQFDNTGASVTMTVVAESSLIVELIQKHHIEPLLDEQIDKLHGPGAAAAIDAAIADGSIFGDNS